MRLLVVTAACALSLMTCVGPAAGQVPFTYQGYMETSGTPYTGTADVRFELTDAALSTANVFGTVNSTNVAVTKGVLTASVDFGQNYFSGGARRYLRVSARTPAGSGTYQTLGYQEVMPVPFAYSAGTALALPGVSVTNGAINLQGAISKSGPVTSTGDLGLYTLSAGDGLRLVTNGGAMNFFTNSSAGTSASPAANSAAMTVSGTGLIGMGTQSPATKLHVAGGGGIRYTSDASASPAAAFTISSGAALDLVGTQDIYMQSTGGRKHILLNPSNTLNGNVGIGTANPAEKLHVAGNVRANVVIIDGGADVAENYDISGTDGVVPTAGMVVAIDPDRPGMLRVAVGPYNRAIAGVISGANGVHPGLILGQTGTAADGKLPVANVGRVWCMVDADANGPIVPGDLLTSSATPGLAMRVTEHDRANGAVLGKAMTRLEKGQGMVLVLVSLQ